ncbi:MAG TPA: outer membrane beta-barrel protein, partial [Ohtaekwangia sp.]|nr:outer membrane beta-barrel protein [Ohtaekwangia sp.]
IPSYIDETVAVKGSYSSGFSASLTIGYPINEIIGVEINGQYSHGKKYKTTSISEDIIDGEVVSFSRGKATSRANVMLISPSLVLTAPGNKLRPYVSAGVVFAIAKLEHEHATTSNDLEFEPAKFIVHEKYTGGISIGMRGGVGVNFKLTESLSLFSEISFNSISHYPKEKEITKYEVDGQNLLETMDERTKRTFFVKKVINDTRNGPPDNSKPGRAQRVSFGMGNLTANIGLKVNL